MNAPLDNQAVAKQCSEAFNKALVTELAIAANAVNQIIRICRQAQVDGSDSWEWHSLAIEALAQKAGLITDRAHEALGGGSVIGGVEQWFDLEEVVSL